jgi:hypothetical protein
MKYDWNFEDGDKKWKIIKHSDTDYSTISSAFGCVKHIVIPI